MSTFLLFEFFFFFFNYLNLLTIYRELCLKINNIILRALNVNKKKKVNM